jgi:hypothetical protein
MPHSVPFEIEDQDVDQFECPPAESVRQETLELVETWESPTDLTDYIDYGVKCIREAQALAQAAKAQADFANKTAKGYLANVEYRRGLIESALELSVAQGLVPQPKAKAADYSLGIQGTAGRVEVDGCLDEWREAVEIRLTDVMKLVTNQVISGEAIEISGYLLGSLQRLQDEYKSIAGEALDKDFALLNTSVTLTWDKKFLAQALKNNWLSEKLAGLFTVIKKKALVIRL